VAGRGTVSIAVPSAAWPVATEDHTTETVMSNDHTDQRLMMKDEEELSTSNDERQANVMPAVRPSPALPPAAGAALND